MERKEKIANLTQHPASAEQIKDGVFDLGPEKREKLGQLLTFEEVPNKALLQRRAEEIVDLLYDGSTFVAKKAMIGGAPFLMGYLENELRIEGVSPLYAFSRRESIEKVVNGETQKLSVFKHLGFVETHKI